MRGHEARVPAHFFHAKTRPNFDPWPRRRHRPAAAVRTSIATSSSRWPARSPRAIERPGHLVVEAGTGVGKSFAYLVPAIQAAVALKKKVVVSTHTIALQEQLVGKDIPFLRSVMGAGILGRSGQGPVQLHQPAAAGCGASAAARPLCRPPGDRPVARDRGVGQANQRRQPRRPRLSSLSQPCGRPSRARTATAWARNARGTMQCFFYAARRRAQNANILIVNHALFVTDLALRAAGLRPAARLRSRDHRRGAHARIGRRRAPGAEALEPRRRLHAVAALQRANRPGAALGPQGRRTAIPLGREGPRRPLTSSSTRSRTGTTASDRASTAGSGSRSAARRFFPKSSTSWPPRSATRLARSRRRPSESSWTPPRSGAGRLRARSRTGCIKKTRRPSTGLRSKKSRGSRVRLASAPLDVAPAFGNSSSSEVPTCVLTSATLCVGSPPRFDFIQSRLGLDRPRRWPWAARSIMPAR